MNSKKLSAYFIYIYLFLMGIKEVFGHSFVPQFTAFKLITWCAWTCVLCAFLLNIKTYSKKQMVIFAISAVWSLVVYYFSKDPMLLFALLLLYAAVHVSFKNIALSSLCGLSLGTVIVFALCAFGLIQNIAMDFGPRGMRYGLGFINPNVTSYFISLIISLALYCTYKKQKLYHTVFALILLLIIYKKTGSRTGVLVSLFSVASFFLARRFYFFRKMIQKYSIPFALTLFTFMILIPLFYKNGGHGILEDLNRFSTNRIRYGRAAYDYFGFSLFGKNFNPFPKNFILDVGFQILFLRYGIIYMILFISMYVARLHLAKKENDLAAIILILYAFCHMAGESNFAYLTSSCVYLLWIPLIFGKHKTAAYKNSVLFLFPCAPFRPIGGLKVVCEYANRLAEAGYKTTIAYSITPPKPYDVTNTGAAKALCKHMVKLLFNLYTSQSWFNLDSRVEEIAVWNFEQKRVPKSDIYVATGVRTAYYLDKYVTEEMRQKKFYLIQDFENWGCPDSFVSDSYKLNLRKFVIAPWLLEKVKDAGSDAVLLYNGFDKRDFFVTNPAEQRKDATVALLYHTEDRKRLCDALAALRLVKEKVPELKVSLFGHYKKPKDLPDWCAYFRNPDIKTHRKLLNDSAIFITASRTEGFALPPAEAMLCGCAVCGTDIPGLFYLKNGETALTSPVYGAEALAKNIITLIQNKELRLRLSKAGTAYIGRFDWNVSFKILREEFER